MAYYDPRTPICFLNIGDKVKIKSSSEYFMRQGFHGVGEIITGIEAGEYFRVRFSDGYENTYKPEDVERVAKEDDFWSKCLFEDMFASLATEKIIKSSLKERLMSYLKTIPARLKKVLNANYQAFYKLQWVDENLEITPDGRKALTNMLFDLHEKELGVIALKEVQRVKKEQEKEE